MLSGTNGGGYEATLLGQTALDYMYAFLWQLPAWMYMLQEMTGKSADRLEKSCSWWSGRLAGRLQCASCSHSDGSNEQVSCRLQEIAISSGIVANKQQL